MLHLAGIAAGAVLLLTGSAAARTTPRLQPEVTCSFAGPSANKLSVTILDFVDRAVVERVGDQIEVFAVPDFVILPKGKRRRAIRPPAPAPMPCSGNPTVHNTDLIDVQVPAESDVEVDISLEGGPLAPGATPEPDGTSEIETQVELLDPGQVVEFDGGPEPDWFRFGTKSGVRGVNLNAQDESASPDIDATMTFSHPLSAFENQDGEWPVAQASTHAGDDQVTTSGGPEFDGSFGGAFQAIGGSGNDTLVGTDPQFTFLNGGPGDDRIQAGPKFNVIRAGSGNDVVSGGPGQDLVELGKGHDTASLDGGKDGVAGFDRERDMIDCGPQRDFASRDRSDRLRGCERTVKRRVPFNPIGD